jgi:hypothetical protein
MYLFIFLLFSSIYCSTPVPPLNVSISPVLFKRLLNIFDTINGFRINQSTELYTLLKDSRTITALVSTRSEHIKSMADAVKELIKGENLYCKQEGEDSTRPDPILNCLENLMRQLNPPYRLLSFIQLLQIITFQLSEANADQDQYKSHLSVEQFMLKITDLLKDYTAVPDNWNDEFKETIRKVNAACIKSATVQPELENPTPPVLPSKVITLQPLYDEIKLLLKDQMNPKLFEIFLEEPKVVFRCVFGNLRVSIQRLKDFLSPEKLFELSQDQQAPELVSAIDDIQLILGEINLKNEALGGVYKDGDISYPEIWVESDFPKFLEKLVSLLVAIKNSDRTKFHYLASVQEICTSLEWILESHTAQYLKNWAHENQNLIKRIHENCRHDLVSPFVFKKISDQSFDSFVEACKKIHEISGQQNQKLFDLLVDRKHFDALLRMNLTFFDSLKGNISNGLLGCQLKNDNVNLDKIFKLKSTVTTAMVSPLAELGRNAYKQLQLSSIKFEEFTQTLIELFAAISAENLNDYDFIIDPKKLLESLEDYLADFTSNFKSWSNDEDQQLVKEIYEASYNSPRSLEARKKTEELQKVKEPKPDGTTEEHNKSNETPEVDDTKPEVDDAKPSDTGMSNRTKIKIFIAVVIFIVLDSIAIFIVVKISLRRKSA